MALRRALQQPGGWRGDSPLGTGRCLGLVSPREMPFLRGRKELPPMPAEEPCSPEPCCGVRSQGAIITHSPSTFPKAQEAFGYPASSIPLSSDQLVQVLQQPHTLLFSHSSQRTSPPYIDLFPRHPREQLAANKEEGDPLPGVVTALYPGGTDSCGDGHPNQSLMLLPWNSGTPPTSEGSCRETATLKTKRY